MWDAPLSPDMGKYEVLGNGSLVIYSLGVEDEGLYVCLAANGVGEANHTVDLGSDAGESIKAQSDCDDCMHYICFRLHLFIKQQSHWSIVRGLFFNHPLCRGTCPILLSPIITGL